MLKMRQICLRLGLCGASGPAGAAQNAPTDLLVGLGGETPLHSHFTRRLWCLVLSPLQRIIILWPPTSLMIVTTGQCVLLLSFLPFFNA